MTTTSAILITPNSNRKQLQDLAPGRITAVYEIGTKVRGTLDLIERDATKGKFKALVLPTLRLGAGTRALVKFLRVLSELEIRMENIEQPGLVLDESQTLLLRFLDEVLTGERRSHIQSGVESARRAGRTPGRPKVVIPTQVFALADQGLSLRAIAREVGLGASTVGRALQARRVLHPHPRISDSGEGV